jgi:hypothetical protein
VSASKLAGHGRIMVCTYMICDIPEDSDDHVHKCNFRSCAEEEESSTTTRRRRRRRRRLNFTLCSCFV